MNQSGVVHYCTDCDRIYDSHNQEFLNCGSGGSGGVNGKRSRNVSSGDNGDCRVYKKSHVSYQFDTVIPILLGANFVDKEQGSDALYTQIGKHLKDGASPNFCVKWGDNEMVTTLTWAIRKDDIRLFELFLQYRANPDAGIADLLKNLDNINNQLPPNMRQPPGYQARPGQGLPIFESIEVPHGSRFLEMLIKYNVSHSVRNTAGEFPIHAAVRASNDNVEKMEMLLGHGADPSTTNNAGLVPLRCVYQTPRTENNYLACVRLLLIAGAPVDTTTLAYMAIFEFRDVVKLMLHVLCAHRARPLTIQQVGRIVNGRNFGEMRDIAQTYLANMQQDHEYVKNLPRRILQSQFGYDLNGRFRPNTVNRLMPLDVVNMICRAATADISGAPVGSMCCDNIDQRIFAHQPPVQE